MADNPLKFKMQDQEQSEWCWAAVTKSILKFYRLRPDLTQCMIVCDTTGLDNCCTNGSSSACNVPWDIELVMPNHGISGWDDPRNGRIILSFDEIKTEIDEGRVICARMQKANGTGHFVVIYGYSEADGQRLFVEDPDTATSFSTPLYETFKTGYKAGKWNDTFITMNPEV